jgi:hypothetical protein
MQRVKELLRAYQRAHQDAEVDPFLRLAKFVFLHSKTSTKSAFSAFFPIDPPIYAGQRECMLFHEYGAYRTNPRNSADVRNLILSDPYVKGTLVEPSSGFFWIFRPAPPRVSCDNLFWKKYDRSNVRGRAADFKEFLWDEILDCYINHDNPCTDPLQGKREKILSHLSPLFRVANLDDGDGWKPVLIDKLPDPTIGRPLSFDTLKRYIQELMK